MNHKVVDELTEYAFCLFWLWSPILIPHTVIITGHQTPQAPPTSVVFLTCCITSIEKGMTVCVCSW